MAAKAPRVFNFSAGPAALPEEVLQQTQEDIWSLYGTGIGILEHSHRGKAYDRVIAETLDVLRKVSKLGSDYDIVLMPGGATVQFALLPMNFLRPGDKAAFLDTSIWTRVAYDQAVKQVPCEYVWTGKATNYDRLPKPSEIPACKGFAYLQYCTNSTVEGTQFAAPFAVDAPTVCDTSSDVFSRPYDYGKHAIVLACAQKNLGPAGNTVLYIRRDWMERSRDDISPILSFKANHKAESRLNTPNTFGVYLMGAMARWILAQGGMEEMGRRSDAKAKLLYEAIDGSGGFYQGTAQAWCRSQMNVTFRIANRGLEPRFIEEAEKAGLDGLAGHRVVGGMRASLYNGVTIAACQALVGFLREFQRRNG